MNAEIKKELQIKEGVPKMTQAEQQVLTIWQDVPEMVKGKLIAKLLDRTELWHQFAVTENIALGWLKAKFENAGIPFIQ